jgi:hypothetical protein
MEFEAIGYVNPAIDLAAVDEITLPLGGDIRYSMATRRQERGYPFTITGRAPTLSEAESIVNQAIQCVSDFIAYFFRVPIYIAEVERVTDTTRGFSQARRSIGGMAALAIPITPEHYAQFVQEFIATVQKPPASKRWATIHLYRDAKESRDPIRRFWTLYSILQILIGERGTIDRLLQRDYTLPLLWNDKESNERTRQAAAKGKPAVTVQRTILTCIRDAFSHSQATFDGSLLDIEQELSRHLSAFEVIVQDLIRKMG